MTSEVRRIVALTMAAVMLLLTGCGCTSTITSTVSQTSSSTSKTTTSSSTSKTTTSSSTSKTTTVPEQERATVQTGADLLVASDFAAIAGKRVGLISHQNSVVNGRHLADHLKGSERVELVALFGPEHGARGDRDAGEYVEDTTDPATGVRVFSLFGETRQPTPSMLEGIDVLLYDLQDVGTRYYTYISTMGLAMQAAAAADIPFIVLDRPNPLGGHVGGGVLDKTSISFVGLYPVPETYGLTAGELALAAQANEWLPEIGSLQLSVIEMTGWDASMRWPDTGLDWIAPSPALTSADSAIVYPATVYLEATSLSYGRGTDHPFTLFGAPWLDAQHVVDELSDLSLPGLQFTATTTTPRMLAGMTVEPAFLDVEIAAVQVDVVDHTAVRPAEAGVQLLRLLVSEGQAAGVDVLSRPEWIDQLSGSSRLREDLERDAPAAEIIRRHGAEVLPLSKELKKHHLYPRSSG
jgi:uncharacterized protein YbbC (DUF1343 family)